MSNTLPAVRESADIGLAGNAAEYLRDLGWQSNPPGVAGSLWHHPGAASAIGLPTPLLADTVEWSGVVERIARFVEQPVAVVAEAIENRYIDVARVRAANDVVIQGTIPLDAGATLIVAAYGLLRAAGTTAQGVRGYIGGNFSRRGQEIVGQARLGQTERGSYIVPILVPLNWTPPASTPRPRRAIDVGEASLGFTSVAADQPISDLDLREHEETPPRRVTRTLAQALAAIDRILVQPAREISADQLNGAVAAGVSHEMLTAAYRILGDEAVGELEVRFSWAPGFREPGGVAPSVTIDHEAAPLLRNAANRLKTSRVSNTSVMTGPISEASRPPGEQFGEITIQTVRQGRPTHVRARLPTETFNRALDWMRDERAVLLEGQVRTRPGQRAIVDNPQQLLPVDETFLDVTT